MKFLVVVHRYWPNAGGSEANCYRFAKQASKMGADVTILTQDGQAHDNVKVTTDINILVNEKFDLIFVHGSCPIQDVVLNNIEVIQQVSPVFYLIVQPSDSEVCQRGMQHAKVVGIGTSFDKAHCEKYRAQGKMSGIARPYFYPIDNEIVGVPGFRERYDIKTPNMFISTGGFWPHKRMNQLEAAFREAGRDDTTLVLMGYDIRFGSPPLQSEFVKVIVGADQQEVMNGYLESNLYILNSLLEGYGLGILEAMQHNVPWISTDVAAAHDLEHLGTIFDSHDELVKLIKKFSIPYDKKTQNKINEGKKYVDRTHSSERCVIGMYNIIAELNSNGA